MNNLKNFINKASQGVLSLIVLVLFIFASVALLIFNPETEVIIKKQPLVFVNTITLEIQDIAPTVEYTGRLEPSKKAELKFEMNGKVSKRLVEPGQFVKLGEKILILEEYYIYKKLFDLAKKNYQLQTKEVERMEVLDKKSLLSRSQYDKTVQKQIELESYMYKAEQDFNKTFLKAKFSGVINEISLDEGDAVTPNIVIANLIDISSLDLYVEVRRDVVDNLQLNMPVEVKVNGVTFLGKLASFQTSPNLETYTHLLRVRLKEKKLSTGMTATAKFTLSKINNIFAVPVSSVLNDNNKKSVFIVLNRKLQKREVNIVTRFDDRYLINGNIKNGEIMVVTDVSSLSDDQEVLISKKQN